MYKKKQSKAWQLINGDVFTGFRLKECYNVVKDLNKKTKWLREIESDSISTDILMEEYKNSDILLKESHVFDEVTRDPFILSPHFETELFNNTN